MKKLLVLSKLLDPSVVKSIDVFYRSREFTALTDDVVTFAALLTSVSMQALAGKRVEETFRGFYPRSVQSHRFLLDDEGHYVDLQDVLGTIVLKVQELSTYYEDQTLISDIDKVNRRQLESQCKHLCPALEGLVAVISHSPARK